MSVNLKNILLGSLCIFVASGCLDNVAEIIPDPDREDFSENADERAG